MRRLIWTAGALAAVLVLLVLVGPGIYLPIGDRLAIVDRPSDHGLRYEDVAFAPRDRALTLRGWWIPAEQARAAVVLVHGGGDNRTVPFAHALDLARDLVAHGYTLVMFDLRNYGESDGSPEGITYGDLEANDVIGAVDFIGTRAPGLRVGALGFSMGGATALRAAARDRRVRAVVADSAFADAGEVAPAFASASMGMPWLLAASFVWSARHLHGLPLARGSTVSALRGATMPPVLLIQDEHDAIVPVAHVRRLAAVIPNAVVWTPALEWTSPFGTHCMAYRLAPEAYVARVTGFFDAVFTAPE